MLLPLLMLWLAHTTINVVMEGYSNCEEGYTTSLNAKDLAISLYCPARMQSTHDRKVHRHPPAIAFDNVNYLATRAPSCCGSYNSSPTIAAILSWCSCVVKGAHCYNCLVGKPKFYQSIVYKLICCRRLSEIWHRHDSGNIRSD